MKIDTIHSCIVDLPLLRPHRLAMTTLQRLTFVLIRIHTDTGTEGLGEIPVLAGGYGEDVASAVKVIIDEALAPALIGHDPLHLESANLILDRRLRGNRAAKAGLEMACADAAARGLGVPVSALLGGQVVDRLPVLWVLANGDAGADIAEARTKLAERTHRLFLVKLGRGDLREDISRALAVKHALGDDACVRVDINQAWDESEADFAMRELEAGGVEVVEQPIGARQRAGMARLAQRHAVPLMADEAVATCEDALDLAQLGACDAFSLKLTKHGGFLRTRRVAHIAQAAGISLFGGTMLEGNLGTCAAAQFFSTLPTLRWGCQLFGPQLLRDHVSTAPLRYEEFQLVVPNEPGLGAELDEDKLAFYRRAH